MLKTERGSAMIEGLYLLPVLLFLILLMAFFFVTSWVRMEIAPRVQEFGACERTPGRTWISCRSDLESQLEKLPGQPRIVSLRLVGSRIWIQIKLRWGNHEKLFEWSEPNAWKS